MTKNVNVKPAMLADRERKGCWGHCDCGADKQEEERAFNLHLQHAEEAIREILQCDDPRKWPALLAFALAEQYMRVADAEAPDTITVPATLLSLCARRAI